MNRDEENVWISPWITCPIGIAILCAILSSTQMTVVAAFVFYWFNVLLCLVSSVMLTRRYNRLRQDNRWTWKSTGVCAGIAFTFLCALGGSCGLNIGVASLTQPLNFH